VSATPRPGDARDTDQPSLDTDTVRARLDHEHRLVSEAIFLVSSGASPRVTVAGLRYGEQILEAVRPLAAARRVRLIPIWTTDESGADVQVERMGGRVVEDPVVEPVAETRSRLAWPRVRWALRTRVSVQAGRGAVRPIDSAGAGA
jgi:hypothetical protein